MDCPNCVNRQLAFLCKVDGLVDLPGGHDRLCCPQCGHVVHRAVEKKAAVPLKKVVPTKSVPRGTSAVKKTIKAVKQAGKRGKR